MKCNEHIVWDDLGPNVSLSMTVRIKCINLKKSAKYSNKVKNKSRLLYIKTLSETDTLCSRKLFNYLNTLNK